MGVLIFFMADLSEMFRTTDLRDRDPHLSAFDDPVSRELAIEFVAGYRAWNAVLGDPRDLTLYARVRDLGLFRTLERSAIEAGHTERADDEQDLATVLRRPS